ncbi:MAG: FtsQ-type POTRA domain-containing protein [Spirochaetaceae bacterium]|nr:FtsQ-type POTRA domain-containing protein [Spirochaetaceae bacterium]
MKPEFTPERLVGEEEVPSGGGREESFRFEKPLMRVFIICSLLLLGELLWLFVIGPCMPLSAVDISGIDTLSRITVLDKAGITSRTSYFSFDIPKAEEGLLSIPQVARVEISKHFPDTVRIQLYGRSAAALSLTNVNGRIVPVIFDSEGVVFQIGDTGGGLARQGALPILSGLTFENVRTGLRLPDFLVPLLRSIKELKDTAPELLQAISEMQINKKTNDSFEVTLYPVQTPVRIKIGTILSAEKVSYALLLLDVLKERRIRVDEIDFRSGTASYKIRE